MRETSFRGWLLVALLAGLFPGALYAVALMSWGGFAFALVPLLPAAALAVPFRMPDPRRAADAAIWLGLLVTLAGVVESLLGGWLWIPSGVIAFVAGTRARMQQRSAAADTGSAGTR